jgi:DnaJ-class molecular chaperone
VTPKNANASTLATLMRLARNNHSINIIGISRLRMTVIPIRAIPDTPISWDSDDVFAELLRARANRRGQDLRYSLPIEFIESIRGADKRLTLPDGGTLDVKIPPGLVDGQILRLKGKGAAGAGKGGPGDALIEVEVLPDGRFVREGDDISLELPISLSEAVLGGKVRVPTPTGDVTMSVPKGANTGTTLRLKGKGVPRRSGGHGDEFVKLKVVLPPSADPELETFVSNWTKGKDFNPREGRTR